MIRVAGSVGLSKPLFGIIKQTVFRQFCGGETIEEVSLIAEGLKERHIGSIIDFAAEPDLSPKGEDGALPAAYFDESKDNILKAIDAASSTAKSIVAVKFTSLFEARLLENLSKGIRTGAIQRAEDLTDLEVKHAYSLGWDRFMIICKYAGEKNVRLAIDAEQSFVQDAIDSLCMDSMRAYNELSRSDHPLILNTYQMYRKDGMSRLLRDLDLSRKNKLHFGAKIVRGAYAIGEKIWAREQNYECPVFDTIEETHAQYSRSIKELFSYIASSLKNDGDGRFFEIVFATHNAESVRQATELMLESEPPMPNARISFAQLYGMSDTLTFSIVQSGYKVYKYLPFGRVQDVIPYLIRRSQENSTIFKHASSDASIMWSELKSRIKI